MPKMIEYIERHAGQPAYIFGTGPSLDAFDFDSIPSGAVRIFINRAIFERQVSEFGLNYWLMIDDPIAQEKSGPWALWLDSIARGNGVTGLFRRQLLAGRGYTDAPEHEFSVLFGTPSGHQPGLLSFSRESIATIECLYAFCGTVAPAIHWAWLVGCSPVHLVGVDGGTGHAGSVDEWQGSETTVYDRMKSDGLMAAGRLGVEIIDHSKQED